MKKILTFGLALLFLGSALFADDAKVMPTRVGRFYLAPSFMYADRAFDDDGDRGSIDTVKAFNLSAALEYGVISWVTAAVQWVPGINIWSDVDTTLGASSSVNIFGAGDLFVGAKVQILGTEAPVKTDRFRLAFAAGVKIPMPGPDYKDLATITPGDDVTAANVDKHVLGLGLRSYFDFIINDNFFINLYNEFLYFPMKGDFDKAGIAQYQIAQSAKAAGVGVDVDYGYDLTFEIEPVFSYPLADGITFSAGLPVNYKTTPGAKYDLSGAAPAVAGIQGAIDTNCPETGQTHILTVRPNASFFFTGWFLPVEFKLGYYAPVWGRNERAGHTVSLQIKAYFRI